MRRLRRWFEAGVRVAELPPDVVLDVPRVTAIGTVHLYLENHRGLEAFSATEIRFRTTTGRIAVRGEDLVLRALDPSEALVEGRIRSVDWDRSE
ncbi:sporulation protein YqfC [Hydrogenibacillus sp. N12]|uniref:sporulation protein YqfC n=1 Tax=Hydrogenibacillus sp. N12 TaxID=2866627 RepID=UPI001C7D9B0B|nr:sporulation protein YqfC [Hydrogenibacillus sp. N12]QZA32241.1 sporulation protein YqfC [Hydrogenibacillus sp. N12]